ncbi:MAG TPA: OmpA family protein, partial [Burkholderiaceae bacterium]
MNKPIARLVLQWSAVGAALMMLSGAGCQSTGPTVISNELPFDQAVIEATDGLVTQTQKMPAFLAKVEAKVSKKALIIDPMIDAASGQQIRITRQLEQKVSDRLGSQYPQFEILPFQPASLARAQYLLIGTMARSAGGGARKPFQINLALVDLGTRSVVAQASALARDDGLDTSPTAYYQDSPVLVKDQVLDAYIRTAQTAPGQAADAYYLERLSAAVLINDGTNAYNASQYQDALGLYRNALATPAGEQLRALN